MSEKRADPHAKAPVQLTQDEIRVLKECRVNSLYYRGIPLGLASALIAKASLDTGYFPFLKKWSRAVYFGVFGMGMVTGIASYKDTCFKKIMALENSSLKEQFVKFQRDRGMFPNQQSEFAPVEDTPLLTNNEAHLQPLSLQTSTKNEFDSPLLNRMQEGKSWEQIRKNSSTANQPQQTQDRPSAGLTYEELRKRNRPSGVTNNRIANQEDTSEEPEDRTKKPLDIESYTPMTFTEDKSSRALNFSADNDSRMTSFRSDHFEPDKLTDSESTKRAARAKSFTRPARKNEYGDEIQ